MSLPLMGARDGDPAALDRAAGIEQVVAQLGELSPAADVARAARLLVPPPGDPDALDAAAADYERAGREITHVAEQLERDLQLLSARWQGDAARAAAGSGRGTRDAAAADAARFAEVARVLGQLAAGLREDWRALEAVVTTVAGLGIGLAVTGPLIPAARDEVIGALLAGAALLRRIHQRDQDAVAALRALMGDAVPTDRAVADGAVADGAVADGAVADGAVADGAVAPVPFDGGRLVGLDAPAPGQSGIQYGWGGVTTVTLNDADATAVSDKLGYSGAVTTLGGVLAAVVPPLGVPLALLGGDALLTNQLIKDHRTPAGVRLTFLGAQIVAAHGR